jgi:hypothetical protein
VGVYSYRYQLAFLIIYLPNGPAVILDVATVIGIFRTNFVVYAKYELGVDKIESGVVVN